MRIRTAISFSPARRQQAFFTTVGIFFAVTLWHMLALPVSLSYDSRIYIRMADALFTPGFPENFVPNIRTPGVSALFRLGFELFGRQPLAIIAINTIFASAGVLALAFTIRRLAGPLSAAAAVLVLAFCPLLISYDHFALSEAGSFAYLALITALLCWRPHRTRRLFLKACGLALLLAAGYQHRPPLVELAPVVAILFALWHWPHSGLHQGKRRTRAFALLTAQLLVILIVPQLSVRAYAPYMDTVAMTDMSVRQGIVRQAVVPPGDPRLGTDDADYSSVVRKTIDTTGMISGMPIDDIGRFTSNMFQQPGLLFKETGPANLKTLVDFGVQYPARLGLGIARTFLLFAGMKGNQSTNLTSEMAVIGIVDRGYNEIGTGGVTTGDEVIHAFEQKTGTSPVNRLLWGLVKPYRALQLAAGLLLILAFGLGLVLRTLPLVTLSAIPIAYWAMHAIIMASEDRYGFPAMPIALAVMCALPGLLHRWYVARVKVPAGSRQPRPVPPETA